MTHLRHVAVVLALFAIAALDGLSPTPARADPGDDAREVGMRPAPEDSSPPGSRAPVGANGLPDPQRESRPPKASVSPQSVATASLLPIGTSRPPASWASNPLALSSGQKCYSKITQYDIGNFPLFTHDLHTWQEFSPGSWVVVHDEWIAQFTWNEWELLSNVEGHYTLAYDTVESWANSHYSSTAPSPFLFFDAWPYMRNDIT
jgi:hypothetical protein